MGQKPETRSERIERLKNKFRTLGGLRLLKEYVRYERARDGTLPHPFPPSYVEEIMEALERLIREHYDDGRLVEKRLDIVRRFPSEPFVKP
jgi:hypothetical protein